MTKWAVHPFTMVSLVSSIFHFLKLAHQTHVFILKLLAVSIASSSKCLIKYNDHRTFSLQQNSVKLDCSMSKQRTEGEISVVPPKFCHLHMTSEESRI